MHAFACFTCKEKMNENSMVIFACGMIVCQECIKLSKHLSGKKCAEHRMHLVDTQRQSKSINVNDLLSLMTQMQALFEQRQSIVPKIYDEMREQLEILKAEETIMLNEKQKLKIQFGKVRAEVDGYKEEQARKKRAFQMESSRLQAELREEIEKQKRLWRELKQSQVRLSKLDKQYQRECQKVDRIKAQMTQPEEKESKCVKKQPKIVESPQSKWLSALQDAEESEQDTTEITNTQTNEPKTYRFAKSKDTMNPFDLLE